VVSTLARTFEEDWAASEPDQEQALRRTEIGRAAKKLSKEVSKSLRVDHVVKGVVQAVRKQKKIALRPKEIESAVKRAVKDTVRDVAEKRVARAMKEMGHAAEATE
jgi:hypothetical protein